MYFDDGVDPDTPALFVTDTSTIPAVADAGMMAVMELLAEFTVNDAAGIVPNFTAVTLEKLTPRMVRLVPPAVDPDDDERLVMTAVITGVVNVRVSLGLIADEPYMVVTWTSTWPEIWAGDTADIVVGDVTVKLVAAVPPKLTPVATVKFAPVTIMVAPPEVVAVPGETELIDGRPIGA